MASDGEGRQKQELDAEPNAANHFRLDHIGPIVESYQHLLGRTLLPPALEGTTLAKALYHAPFALVSHDTQADPLFNYANLTAQQLFGMTWGEFVRLPSRYSAEEPRRATRAQLLQQVAIQGYIDNYSGIRIAKNGQRFAIEQATVWNVTTRTGVAYGQAALFAHWVFL